jgi:hypothetical protein
MDLPDGVSQPGVADRPCRRRPVAPGVVAGLRDTLEHPAAGLHRQQACTGSPSAAITWTAANRRKGGRLLERLGGSAGDRQLGLQLRDPAACRYQLVVLVAA